MIARTVTCLVVIALFTLAVNLILLKYQTELMDNANHFIDLTKKIPTEFGPWKRTHVEPLQDYAVEQLKVRDAEHWTYTNMETGEEVYISFLVGPTGRLSVHTPEICLAGSGFRPLATRQREKFITGDDAAVFLDENPIDGEQQKPASDEPPDEFWTVAIGDPASPSHQMIFYYALGTGKHWWAKENPRYELANYPFVLKMQIETIAEGSSSTHGTTRLFLKDFLPEVKKVFAETDLQSMYGK